MGDERLAVIEEKVDAILNNHLAHIQSSLVKVETNMDWITKFFWMIASLTTASIVASIASIILKK